MDLGVLHFRDLRQAGRVDKAVFTLSAWAPAQNSVAFRHWYSIVSKYPSTSARVHGRDLVP